MAWLPGLGTMGGYSCAQDCLPKTEPRRKRRWRRFAEALCAV
jgi:hypothetical protein